MGDEAEQAAAEKPAREQKPKGIGLGYLIYQQVAGVLGAFSLVAILEHFIHLEWRSPLSDLIAMWGHYVRPAIKWLFDITIVTLVKLIFHWRIEIPLFIRDYVAVGIVYYLSTVRDAFSRRDTIRSRWGYFVRGWKRIFIFMDPTEIFIIVLLWPTRVFRDVKNFYIVTFDPDRLQLKQIWKNTSDEDIKRFLRVNMVRNIVVLSPLIYLVLLLAANYLLLKPGT